MVQAALTRGLMAVEHAVDTRIGAYLSQRHGWSPTVLPYVGYGTPTQAHLRARVLLRRREPARLRGRTGDVARAVSHFLSADLPGQPVTIEVGDREARSQSGREGYVEATIPLPDLAPGWHPVTYTLDGTDRPAATGRLVVVDPAASLGVVSDIDDTIMHTGLTRLVEAVRTTLFVPEHARLPVAGAAELYRSLVACDDGRAQLFYVSSGAWNTHPMLERFLDRHDFPAGPLVMTDWGPGTSWLFRESSISFKARVVLQLVEEHPHLRWVLVGDSGQDDAEAYAGVARAAPDRIKAVYIREVPPQTPRRTAHVRALVAELADLGVPMVLMRDSVVAAEHAHGLGLLDDEHRDAVRRAAGEQA